MKSFLRVFFAALAGMSLTVAVTQLTQAKSNKSDEIIHKARQLDLLNHLVPLVLTKDQMNKILVAVEKARSKVSQIEQMEATDLLNYESKINDAINKGISRDLVPSKDLLKELNRLFSAFTVRRQIAAGENADAVLAVLKSTLNAGQIKAAANSEDMKAFDPNLDPAKLSDDDKLKFYIKDIVLDPQAYDLLMRMSKA